MSSQPSDPQPRRTDHTSAPVPAGDAGPEEVAAHGRSTAPAHHADPVRASDAEREAAVERLRIASVEGRLTFGELTERTEAAYLAVTRGELAVITADLPGVGAPGARPAPRLEQVRFTAIMGDVKERITGRIEQPLEAVSVMGDVVLDLRYAQVPSGEVAITATAVMGDVKIIVPDGVRVELTGYAVMGDRRVKLGESAPGRSAPTVRVRAQAVMGDVTIVDDEHHGQLKRTFSEWWQSWTHGTGKSHGHGKSHGTSKSHGHGE